MAKFNDTLDRVKIAAPCQANWDEMFSFEGERVRFCSQCKLNVYNLSGMTRTEASALLARTEGRLCVRFYRRADGTVLTQNCPVGLRALKRRVAWAGQVLLGMGLALLGGLGLGSLKPVLRLVEVVSPKPVVMGGIGANPAERQVEPESLPIGEMGKSVLPERLHQPTRKQPK
ncbi:MAG: hypothetical protein HYR56_16810 [Acidobacteria bacterium]|nr:hypothetical protein [Acidobacteriota bacterium]MBI3428040.1 hypothetical protein [Acidobacteriota bacterium]